MDTLWLDFETYNDIDLKAGVYRYAETAEVLLGSYALNDGPVELIDAANGDLLVDLIDMIEHPKIIKTAHNANFDRIIAKTTLGCRTEIEQWRCTMVKAFSHGYPGGLDQLCNILKVPFDKAKIADGKKLINRFCKPAPKNHKADRYTRDTHPAEWQRFCQYAINDIEAMREVSRRLPSWNWRDHDVAMWHLDQKINDRGMQIDVDLARAGAAAAISEKEKLAAEFVELTGGVVRSPMQRALFAKYLNERFDLDLDNTRKDTFETMMKGDGLDPVCRRLMQISILANKSSTAKYAAVSNALQDDGRYRGGLQFRGAARTRRYAGRIFQAQNLPSRGLPPQRQIDCYIAALKADMHDMLFDDLMTFGAAALRGLIIAPPGRKECVADLSNIEGRLGSWFAGEQWKLDAFRAYDAGVGDDLYNITAAGILGGDPKDVSKKNRNAFGKVPDLAGLYMGGFGAFQTFAKTYGLTTPDGLAMANYADTIYANVDPAIVNQAQINYDVWGQEREPDADIREWLACETVKLAWRKRHPATERLWKAIKEAVTLAIQNPGKVYTAGPLLKYVVRRHAGFEYLLCGLPSGSVLCYVEPRVHDDGAITYMGVDSDATGGVFGKWQRLFTHAGKFLEQACQSTAYDIMQHNMPKIEAAGFDIILTVHDEIVCEADTDATVDGLSRLLSASHAWSGGLPLAADGFETQRYRKD